MSGLAGARRLKARSLAKRAALVGHKNAPSLHYTQGARRWEGIDKKLNPFDGECPDYADCSSFATWVLWSVLAHHYDFQKDIVNGHEWNAGYTGTIVGHGKKINHRVNWRRGDLILYGDPFGRTGHVAVYVGNGMVVSHGSEGGPYLIRWNYRSDFHSCRRFI